MIAKSTARNFHLTNLPLEKGLLQNAVAFFIAKRGQNALQNATAFLLQNTSMLSQNAAASTKCVVFIINRDRYYKTRHNSFHHEKSK